MRALSLAVVMVFVLTTGAGADDAVDWSEYVDDRPAPAASPTTTTETAKPAKAKPRAKRMARAKRAAKATKAKARKKARRR